MIKFIYFDVGGVIIKDFSGTNKWEEFMSVLGVKTSDFDNFIKFWKGLEVSVADDMKFIIPLINKKFRLELSEKIDLLSEFTKRFEKNESVWPIISNAKEKYKIGLLTDQYPGMLDDIYNKGLMPDVKFDVIIDSSIEKIKKPNLKIYKMAEEKSGYSGSEILFIDNSQRNLEEPEKMGWHTLLYEPASVDDSNKRLSQFIA